MNDRENQNKRKMGALSWIILIVAIGVFCYAGFRLFGIFTGYQAARAEYSALADEFTENETAKTVTSPAPAPAASSGSEAEKKERTDADPASGGGEAEKKVTPGITILPRAPVINGETMLVEDATPPFRVNWKDLKAVNEEVAGWIYVDAVPSINYPVLHGKDNDTYLHQTFKNQYLYSGSIFSDYHNAADFTDPNTIVYGHNMKDGSMFGKLKELKDQAVYDANPFFWILTPEGSYRYHIFSVFTAGVDSETYTLHGQNGKDFLAWEEEMQKASEVKNDVPLSKYDKTVILSTCTGDASTRTVVIGKCVSSERPVRREAAGLTTVTPTPTAGTAPTAAGA